MIFFSHFCIMGELPVERWIYKETILLNTYSKPIGVAASFYGSKFSLDKIISYNCVIVLYCGVYIN